MSSIVGAALAPVTGGASLLGMGGIGGGGNFNIGSTLGVSNGFQSQTAPGTVEQLTNAQGTYNSNIQGQQALLQALQAQANGQGANPAQALLNQATNQNIAQNTGMIASQKGINPALAARQASLNAANTGQQAAGQAASMQAQQQLGAQNAEAGVFNNIGNQALNQQNIAQQGFYAPQTINAGVAAGNQKTNASLIGGGLSGLGGALAMMAKGGMVPQHYDAGGMIGAPSLDPMSNAQAFFNSQTQDEGKSSSGGGFPKLPGGLGGGGGGMTMAGGAGDEIMSAGTMMAAHGGTVPAMVSPGEKYLNPGEAAELAEGKKGYSDVGETIPGKAKVKGDSYSNDTVSKNLDEGGIVIPRHITQSKNPGEAAKRFVEEQLRKSGAPKQHFADGGDVPEYLAPNAPAQSSPQFDLNDTINTGVSNAQTGAGMNELPSKEDQYNSQVQDYATKNGLDLSRPEVKKGVEQLVLNQFKNQDVQNQWANQDQAKDEAFQAEKANVLGTAPQNQMAPQARPQMPTPNLGANAAQPSANPYNDYINSLNRSLDMQSGAVGLQAQGEKQLAAGQLDVLQRQQSDMQKMNQDYEKRFQDIDQETQAAAKDLQSKKIDPKNFWNSKSLPQKISSTVGLILGGLGSGLTGQENPALKFMNAQIDRDIQAQTLDMDKSKNLMAFNMQRMGNLRAAQSATAAMHMQAFQNELMQASASSQDPMIQARAQMALGQIQRQKADYQRQAALYSTLGNAQGGGDNGGQTLNTLRMIDPERAKEMEGRYIPGVGFGSVKVPDKIRDELAGRAEVEHSIQKLEKFAKENQGSLNPETVNYGKTLARNAQDAFRRANGEGVFREGEAQFINSMIKEDPSAFLAKYRTLPGLKAVAEANRNALNSKLSAYGFNQQRDLSQYEGKPVK